MIIKFCIKKEDESQINDFLLRNNFSKKLISAIKYQGGKILVNNQTENVTYFMKTGDVLEVYLPEESLNKELIKSNINISILYEDDYLLVVDKQALMPTIPSIRHFDNSLANALSHYYFKNNLKANIHFVNRLDKDTSGLVLVVKNRFIKHLFSFVEIKKQYLAIVKGTLNNDLIIEANIKRENEEDVKRVVANEGLYAKTIVKVIKNYDSYSLVELTLCTGRTHQIRVHMAHINHPLLGDTLYGGDVSLIKRQALHAHYLQFIHPITKEIIKIKSELPNDMAKLL